MRPELCRGSAEIDSWARCMVPLLGFTVAHETIQARLQCVEMRGGCGLSPLAWLGSARQQLWGFGVDASPPAFKFLLQQGPAQST